MNPDPVSISICILFYEKAAQTIKCVESFLPSGCPIYVLNNGSSQLSSRQFKDWSSKYPQIVVMDSSANLGVSAGRNRLAQAVASDWLLFVDNDIRIETSDFVFRFEAHCAARPDIEVFIPKLFNVHDGCYAAYWFMKIEGDALLGVSAESNQINMFPGGASLISRKLFERLGYYDEEMFVGFEDIELAVRGIVVNAPVKALLVADIELIHEHKASYTDATDIEAVVRRYDKDRIGKSCEHIYNKHGLHIEDKWELWVDRQLEGIIQLNMPSLKEKDVKAKIVLIADAENWAFYNISKGIQQNLSDRYEIHIKCISSYNKDYNGFISELCEARYDLVHFLQRAELLNLYLFVVRNKQKHKEIIEALLSMKLSFSVYDHSILGDDETKDFTILFKYLADSYVVSSERLFQIYSRLPGYSKPFGIIEDGVDLRKFYPLNTERLSDGNRTLVVGWVGNSKWGLDIDGIDHKGLHTIIKPAVRQLQREGYRIEGRFVDRNVRQIPYDKMVDYYNSIDIYLCASDAEGTPNPVLEAMACGVPIITTDVGIVPQLFGPEQKKLILNVRSVHALKESVVELINNPERRMLLSCENIEQIKGWTREAESGKWDAFFTHLLCYEADPERLKCKRACLEVPYHYQFEDAVDQFLETSWSWKITRPLRVVHWHACYYKNSLSRMLRTVLGRS